MTQTPERWNNSAHSAAQREHYSEQSLEQLLQLLPEPLHYDLLDYFCCLNVSQRRNFILETLNRVGIAYQVLRTKNAFHIIVKPDYEPDIRARDHNLFQAKVFVAHYDRLRTPGANDNSAAVWHLLKLAAQMKSERTMVRTPVQIIFTDHEELRTKEHISKQGAYMLAQHFRKRNPKLRYAFFVFDQCGIGDTLCYLPNIITSKNILAQQDAILQQAREGELASIPIEKIPSTHQYYFSDNLGFNWGGYPALLLCTLPMEDAHNWQHSGQKPTSWQTAQTTNNTPDLLEARSFALMNQTLSRLCRM
ncbi:M28 family peptidase [Candidatus Haliotispira prima]|uniref:M28 family peptidase n=1 Tax=Candidatus Haliotispira prima TaxID=3034016 RepID=A0ABY8MJW9_9SPIO|nr:M28 family peptidase [Candidatus Haliotispira prima]